MQLQGYRQNSFKKESHRGRLSVSATRRDNGSCKPRGYLKQPTYILCDDTKRLLFKNMYLYRSATQRHEIERRHQIVKLEFRHEDGAAPELDQVSEQEGELEQVQVPEQVGQAGQVSESPGERQECPDAF